MLDWADRGAVWSWHGVRFGALGGAVSIDRSVRVENESWWSTETITDLEVDTLIARAPDGLDVPVAHDAPIIPPGIRPLEDLILRTDCDASGRSLVRCAPPVRGCCYTVTITDDIRPAISKSRSRGSRLTSKPPTARSWFSISRTARPHHHLNEPHLR